MDEFTSLENYPVPVDPSLCTAIVAEKDAYVLRSHGAPDFRQVWPGMRVVEMDRVGHVVGYLQGHQLFRDTIANTLRRMESSH
ncbi:unnamed protein product [Nippostrongylus brasiliensis]|uniref:Hydrolase n=1 Tax=Nippostrongylus brasiliensis TaxID=27835 RepID=A0A0N4YFF7_NIPBR|nr:unnamed protein product [Nippostrongylus brasiliensis]